MDRCKQAGRLLLTGVHHQRVPVYVPFHDISALCIPSDVDRACVVSWFSTLEMSLSWLELPDPSRHVCDLSCSMQA